MRLGIYADLLYRRDGGGAVSTDRAFVLFLAGLAERLEEVVIFGRLHPLAGRAPYVLPTRIRFVPFPYYNRATDVAMWRGFERLRRAFSAEVGNLDVVWLFGPHPVALELARLARGNRVPVVFGIRQDFPAYIRGRLKGPTRLVALPAAHGLDRVFRLLAQHTPTVVVGDDLARRYGVRKSRVHATGISLVSEGAIANREEVAAKDWSAELRVLSVGRLDPEKNPLLLPEILARLRRGGSWRLTVVGQGPLADAVGARADALGVRDAIDLRGYVTYGPQLLHLYRQSHVFLHVSLTEGLPQVLYEAQAAGLPIVATDVGGVKAALGHGERGLLVRPRDVEAAAAACERLRDDPALRERLRRRGIDFARAHSMETQLDRLVAFFERSIGDD